MKLDLNCVRDVLIELEEFPIGSYSNESFKKSIAEHGSENVLYALVKLSEAKYINAEYIRTMDGRPHIGGIFDLTFAGHEFLNSVRSPSVWERLKESTVDGGTACLKVVGDIAVEILKEIAKQKLHLS